MEMRSKPSCLRNKNLLTGSLSRASFSCPLQATRSIASVALPLPAPTQISTPEGKAVCSNTFWVLLVPSFSETGTLAACCQLYQGGTPRDVLIPSCGHHTSGQRAYRAAHPRHLPFPAWFLLPEVPPGWGEGDKHLSPAQPHDPRPSSRRWLC